MGRYTLSDIIRTIIKAISEDGVPRIEEALHRGVEQKHT